MLKLTVQKVLGTRSDDAHLTSSNVCSAGSIADKRFECTTQIQGAAFATRSIKEAKDDMLKNDHVGSHESRSCLMKALAQTVH